MWAFVIYDRARDVLFCSRDRFGIKPLNYAVHRGRFLFASEIKAILAAAPELTRPDYASLSMMLRASIGANQEHSCFEGVLRVPAAHNLTVTRRGVRLSRYWDYPTETDERLSPDDAADGLRAQLVDSLRLRMRSDVPVGSTLSGGVDSSSIVCLLREFFDGEHNTFTAQYEGEACDESPRAEALAKSLGMTSNLIPALSHAFLPLLRTIIRHLESPLHNPAVFPLWNIMEAARRKVTVVLEGQGADELLAGYTTFCFPHAIAGALRRGDVAGAARELRWAFRNEGAAKALLWLGRTAAPWGHTLYRTVRGDEGVYAGPLRDVPWHDWERRDAPTMRDPLNRALRAQHSTTLIDLLHYGDAISMAHSIESRLPFLDHRLVEYAFRLPGRHKYRDGHGKAVLKRAVRGRVPEAILDSRRKLGFVVPIADWFRTRPDETVYPVLRSKTCRERGLFDPTRMDRAVRRHIDGHVDLSNTIYRWILTELWFQEFIDRAPSAAAPPARRGARPVAAGAA
jgi:asparagine synthase (glutamine-hydrolysing)